MNGSARRRGAAARRARRDGPGLAAARAFLDLLQDPAGIVDAGGVVHRINAAAERLVGYRAEELRGALATRLLAAPEAGGPVEAVLLELDALATQAPVERPVALRRRDGTVVTVPVCLSAWRIRSRRFFLAVARDGEARERARAALERAQAQAAAAAAAKAEFLANISHELRTPLNAVIGMTGLLLDTDLGAEQRDYAETIRSSGEALLAVINDILDLSQLEAQRLEIERGPVDLRGCVEQALDLVAPAAAAKGLDLACLVEDGTPATVMGDGTRIRQILANLLGNAVKFTAVGEVVVTVSLEPAAVEEPDHCTIRFAVRDTGIGIPPAARERLFQPFAQVDASATRQFGGTGLGLAISRRLAEIMGGTMGVESEVGRGSTFWFTVRVGRVAELAGEPDTTALAGRRILIVDDNATNRRVLTLQAQRWGMLPVAAASAAEALDWIRSGAPFDVVTLDMAMPDVDGRTLARQIRALRRPAPPLVLLSSAGGRARVGGDDEVFFAWLQKPVRQADLRDVLARACGVATPAVRRPAPGRQAAVDPGLARRLPLRILVAGDNPVSRKATRQMLARFGYRADEAATGTEVLEAVRRQPYDVLLLDVQMPEMDGLEVARRIRAAAGPRPRLVAVTAGLGADDREACRAAGMDDFLRKPVHVGELRAVLERCRPAAGAGPDGPCGGEQTRWKRVD